MNNIGIIGGTFNPIHLAHLYIAYEAKLQLKLDKVIFMPAGSPPHKDNRGVLPAEFRLNMVSMAIESYEGFEVSDYEIKKNGLSYTYETLKDFKTKDNNLYFITGADCLINFESWKNPHVILEHCNLVVFNRPGYTEVELATQKTYIEEKYNTNIIFLDIIDLEYSSSLIRNRISDGKRVDFFLPAKVTEYIYENKFYR